MLLERLCWGFNCASRIKQGRRSYDEGFISRLFVADSNIVIAKNVNNSDSWVSQLSSAGGGGLRPEVELQAIYIFINDLQSINY